jgi:hypothetical protein
MSNSPVNDEIIFFVILDKKNRKMLRKIVTSFVDFIPSGLFFLPTGNGQFSDFLTILSPRLLAYLRAAATAEYRPSNQNMIHLRLRLPVRGLSPYHEELLIIIETSPTG